MDKPTKDSRILTQEECENLVRGLKDWFPRPPTVMDAGTDECYGLRFSHPHYVGEGADIRVTVKFQRGVADYRVGPVLLAEYEDAHGVVRVDGAYTPERVAAVKLEVVNAIKGSVDDYATRLERKAEDSRRAADLLCAQLVGKKEGLLVTEYAPDTDNLTPEEAVAAFLARRADGLLSDKTVSLQDLRKKEVLQSLVAACYYQLGVVHLELAEPAPAHEFSWETAQRGERRQGKLDSISSVLLAAEQALRELG